MDLKNDITIKANLYYDYGLLLERLNRYEEAEISYLSAIRESPNKCFIYNKLGLLKEKTGEIEQAIKVYKSVIEIESSNSIANSNLERLNN